MEYSDYASRLIRCREAQLNSDSSEHLSERSELRSAEFSEHRRELNKNNEY